MLKRPEGRAPTSRQLVDAPGAFKHRPLNLIDCATSDEIMLLPFNRRTGLEMKPAPKRTDEVVKRTVYDWLMACFETREVDPQEIDLVWPTHRNKWLRPEVEEKLKQLNLSDSIHRELHHLVSLSLDLFDAVDSGRYPPGKDWPEIEPRLKRALAYFVKNGDAIPDHEPTGFDDDHREFRDLAGRAECLLAHFEAHRRPHG